MSEALKFVMVGHVDHGKSTIIGRLLVETESLMEGQLQKVKETCESRNVPFEYAYLLDAFEEEQEQGITIDITKIEFSTKQRHYTIIDAPGHKEFLKNMISGASRAEAAILVIDAEEGVKEQTWRHAYILSMLGVKQVQVAMNKMDLVDYSEERFKEVEKEIVAYLARLGIEPELVIPVSGKKGDNITSRGKLSWWRGPTLVEAIDAFTKEPGLEEKPLRLPVQDVYKLDDRRIIAGRVEAGAINEGDEVLFLPSGNRTTVKSIEGWPEKESRKTAGYNVGITVADEFYVRRGEVIVHPGKEATQSDLVRCNMFWMGKQELVAGTEYTLKLATEEVACTIHTFNKVIDAETLEETPGTSLAKNDIANLVIRTKKPVVFDAFQEIATMGRFVLVDEHIVAGGGIIERSADELRARASVETKSLVTPKTSLVTREEREERQGHAGRVLWLTGLPGCGKEAIARRLERTLFEQGRNAYHLDAGNIRLSLSSDLGYSAEARHEHARRVAEVANFLLQTGAIVIVTIVSPYKADRAHARSIIGNEYLEVFVDRPLEECKQEDPHGIYTKAEKKEIAGVPGMDIPYEPSDYLVTTLPVEGRYDVDEKVAQLLQLL